jgi:hypothetical protein
MQMKTLVSDLNHYPRIYPDRLQETAKDCIKDSRPQSQKVNPGRFEYKIL